MRLMETDGIEEGLLQTWVTTAHLHNDFDILNVLWAEQNGGHMNRD